MYVSVMEKAGISTGKPPACQTPRFTASARSRRCAWHGIDFAPGIDDRDDGLADDRELNVLNGIEGTGTGASREPRRLFDLLLHRRPDGLLQLAGSGRNGRAFAATQYAIAHGDSKLAQQAVMAAGRSQEPVWTKAYVALTGLYFADRGDAVKSSFLGALGDATIGDRLGTPLDRSQQLGGTIWFYYGSRYGEYQGATNSGDTERLPDRDP